jgi:hypothetical protein
MPIYVSVYHLDKMIVGKTEGQVTLTDLDGYFDAIVKARAVGYRKIFDATSGTSVLTPDEIETFRRSLKAFVAERRGKIGPFAVITGGQRNNGLAGICQAVFSADRPMAVFDDIHAARAWLEERHSVE